MYAHKEPDLLVPHAIVLFYIRIFDRPEEQSLDKFSCTKCYQAALYDFNHSRINNYVRISSAVFRMVFRMVSSCHVCSNGVVFNGEIDIMYI